MSALLHFVVLAQVCCGASLLSTESLKPVVGTSNKSLSDAIITTAADKYDWLVWGKVNVIDDNTFTIDDGSGVKPKVIKTAHSVYTGYYVSVLGSLDITKKPIELTAKTITTLATASSYASADPTSHYDQLSSDILVSSDTKVILSYSLVLTSTKTVYVQSDGRYYPNSLGTGDMYIRIDGNCVTNHSYINWGSNTAGTEGQHSFNCIGAIALAAGTHNIELVAARANANNYTVGAGSNLCIMVSPADSVISRSIVSDTTPFSFTTANLQPGTPVPHTPVMSTNVNNTNGPVIALASGRSIVYNQKMGDAMWGIYKNGSSICNNEGTWTVNDIWSGAETTAPMYCQALMKEIGNYTVSLDASEFPIGVENNVNYRIGDGARFVTMYGGMTVAGSAPLSDAYNNWIDYFALASCYTPTPYPYAAMGQAKVITTANVFIPHGHNGIVMFIGKTRCQGDGSDVGGNVFLWIRIDGLDVGSQAVQQIKTPNGDSQRTMCCSYLAAGLRALRPGYHTVQLMGKATGSFIHMCTNQDCPLIWFD